MFLINQDFLTTCAFPENRGCLEFTVLNFNIYFLSFSIFEQLALALKIFTVFKYFLSFRIFKQLALALNSLY